MRVAKNPNDSPLPAAPVVKSISARDLLLQHQQDLAKMKAAQAVKSPQLGRGLQSADEVDLSREEVSLPASTTKRADAAKLKALRLIQLKGPLKASNPNQPISSPKTPEMQQKIRKRVLDTSPTDAVVQSSTKKSKAELDEILQAKSSHAHLIDDLELQQSSDYFSKMEKKESMETKMLETFEIKTSAISCLKVISPQALCNSINIVLIIIRLLSY